MNIQEIEVLMLNLREKDAFIYALKQSSVYWTVTRAPKSSGQLADVSVWRFRLRVDLNSGMEIGHTLRTIFNAGVKSAELDNISTSGS